MGTATFSLETEFNRVLAEKRARYEIESNSALELAKLGYLDSAYSCATKALAFAIKLDNASRGMNALDVWSAYGLQTDIDALRLKAKIGARG